MTSCTCGQVECDTCFDRTVAEVIQELYETDPAFRTEFDRWAPADSPEGQHILSSIDTQEETSR